jgi:release factor glutamine methyltransferase
VTLQTARQQFFSQLSTLYDDREAAAIANLVMENITGWGKIDRILHKEFVLLNLQREILEKYLFELLQHKPVQYVLHEAWFCGMKFFVDGSVLIPRPETEELVDWIVEEAGSGRSPHTHFEKAAGEPVHPLHIVEVGAGSGCIPVALAKKLPQASLWSCDISGDALQIAHRNAAAHDVLIQFLELDFLDPANWAQLPKADIVVSNPPYIPQSEATDMETHVTAFEPHLALFVKEDNPLIFYEAIADFALLYLNPDGKIFVELHENLADDVQKLFSGKGFEGVVVKKDMQDKTRMLKATRLP